MQAEQIMMIDQDSYIPEPIEEKREDIPSALYAFEMFAKQVVKAEREREKERKKAKS